MRFNIILSILSFFMTLTQITSFSEWWENSKVVDLTNDNFFNTIGKDKYVIVKFFTKWCFYCRKISPIYEKVFDYYNGTRDNLIIARIECGDNEEMALHYQIHSYPTVGIFFPHNTTMQSTFRSERTLENFVSWINNLVPAPAYKSIFNFKEKTNIFKNIVEKNSSLMKPKINTVYIPETMNATDDLIKKHFNDTKSISEELEVLKRQIIQLKSRAQLAKDHYRNLQNNQINTGNISHIQNEISKPQKIKINPKSSINYPFYVGMFLFICIAIGACITGQRIIIADK